MKTLTLRSSAIRPMEREAARARIPEPLYDRGQHLPFKGQKVILPRRHILRCYYYAKGARGKWVSAERAICGSRWNYYMCRGRTTPKPKPPEVHKTPFSDGRMKAAGAKKEGRIATETRQGADTTARAKTARMPRAAGIGISTARCAPVTAELSSFTTALPLPPGTRAGNPTERARSETETPGLPSAAAKSSAARGQEPRPVQAASETPTISYSFRSSAPRSETASAATTEETLKTRVAETRTASENANIAFGVRVRGGSVMNEDVAALGAKTGRGGFGGTNPGATARIEQSDGPATITGNPSSGSANPAPRRMGYVGAWRKREFQLKVASASAEPE